MSNARNIASGAKFVDTAGDTMTGDLTVNRAGHAAVTIEASDTNQATLLFKEGGVSKYNVAHVGSSDTFQVWNYTTNTRALGIDNASRMTLPSQPMFDAYMSATSTVSGVTNMSTTASWGTTTNVGSHFSSGTFTAPVAGKYLFTAGLATDGTYGTSAYFSCEFEINGNRRRVTWFSNYGTSYAAATCSSIFQLSANDYVRIVNESHVSANILGHGSGLYSYFTGMLLG